MTGSKVAEQPFFARRKTHKTSARGVKEEGGMNTESTNVNGNYTHEQNNFFSRKCDCGIKIDNNLKKQLAALYLLLLLSVK